MLLHLSLALTVTLDLWPAFVFGGRAGLRQASGLSHSTVFDVVVKNRSVPTPAALGSDSRNASGSRELDPPRSHRKRHLQASAFRTRVRRHRDGIDGIAVRESRHSRKHVKITKSVSKFQGNVALDSIMMLTFLCMTMYISLASARNIDELSGHTSESSVTETLTVAARGIAYTSLISCLFMSCALEILGNAGGLGGPEKWVRLCMLAATCGMFLHFAMVILLPFVVIPDARLEFAERCGGMYDVHPRLLRHSFKNDFFKFSFLACLAVCMSCIYGGVAGVAYRIYLCKVEKGHGSFSAASGATAILVIAFLLVRFAVWTQWARSRQGSKLGAVPKQTLQSAALSAAFALQKIPMMCVLFLAVQLRAMQMEPWDGKPQPWAQSWMYIIGGANILEALVAAVIGATGEEEVGYFGAHIYQSPWRMLHVLQYTLNAVTFYGFFVMRISLSTLKPPSGPAPRFAPALRCVMVLSIMYYWMHFVLGTLLFIKHVCKQHFKFSQDVALAAVASVSFCPSLSIFFVAARLRAVQITQFKGSPQVYAQDAMYMCVFGAFIQAVCCVAAPMLTQHEAGFDDDGNASYDLGPTLPAYIVTVVKNFVLIALASGVATIAFSMLTITEENANYGTESAVFHSVARVGWGLLVLLLAMLLSSAKVVGHAVKFAVESVTTLGVPLHVGKAAVSLFAGYVNLQNVVVENPRSDNAPFQSQCLLRVESVVVKLKIGQLICTFGRLLEIDVIALKGVEVNYEKTACCSSSNVAIVKKYITPVEKSEGTLRKCGRSTKEMVCGSASNATTTCCNVLPAMPSFGISMSKLCGRSGSRQKENGTVEVAEEKVKEGRVKVILHAVDIRDVGATVFQSGAMFKIRLNNVKFEDLTQEQIGASDIVVLILSSLLWTVMSNGSLVKKACWTGLTLPCPSLRSEDSATQELPAQPIPHLGLKS
eukprot:TRINITY_DN63525_c0_g1_i1.p1 TRINITY_DN63525_c0_g1~~TRINITY_DN63525_c0_g1_i1.p1  ORF type:complete len:939 (-),score=122.39 TRINITY_DN63525_c0_g1_i1:67-2883(-)